MLWPVRGTGDGGERVQREGVWTKGFAFVLQLLPPLNWLLVVLSHCCILRVQPDNTILLQDRLVNLRLDIILLPFCQEGNSEILRSQLARWNWSK